MVDPFIMEDVTECLQAAEPRKFLDPAEKPQKKDHVFNALQKLGVAERQAYIHLHVVWCDRGIDIGFEWIYDIYRWEMVRQVLQVLKKVCKLCVNFLYSEKWLSLGNSGTVFFSGSTASFFYGEWFDFNQKIWIWIWTSISVPLEISPDLKNDTQISNK